MDCLLLLEKSVDFADSAAPSTGVNSVAKFLTLLLIFAIVLGVCLFTTKFVAGKEKSKMQSSNMKVLETSRLSQGKYLQIVQIGTKYVVIASGKDSITKIMELSEEDFVKPVEEEMKGQYFSDILSKISGKKTNESLSDKANLVARNASEHDDYEGDLETSKETRKELSDSEHLVEKE